MIDTETESWRKLWDERGAAIRRELGETVQQETVVPYSWPSFSLPGACALTFGPTKSRASHIYMTVGLTQPTEKGEVRPEWEFAIKAPELAKWPLQILYDLLTYSLAEDPYVSRGLRLPLVFFYDAKGRLCAGLTTNQSDLQLVGSIRGLLLWDDLERIRFRVSSGDFGLMVAVAITQEEIEMASETSPPHVLLLLKQVGVGQLSDPIRKCALQLRDGESQWRRIRRMSHDAAVEELSA